MPWLLVCEFKFCIFQFFYHFFFLVVVMCCIGWHTDKLRLPWYLNYSESLDYYAFSACCRLCLSHSSSIRTWLTSLVALVVYSCLLFSEHFYILWTFFEAKILHFDLVYSYPTHTLLPHRSSIVLEPQGTYTV